jgi:hypothetical protein
MTMTSYASNLRPGKLVAMKTAVVGNVSYKKETIEEEHQLASGVEIERWETTRLTADPEEEKRGQQTRDKVRSMITGVCIRTAFGLLCPEAKIEQLDLAIRDAEREVAGFNAGASITRVTFNLLTGTIAADDVQAVRAINSEVRDLMDQMLAGLEALDVVKIRDAAQRVKRVGQMLSPQAQERVKEAVTAAREGAKSIVAAAEVASAEIDRAALRKVREARTAFLDVEPMAEVQAPVTVARVLDLAPEDAAPVTGAAIKAPRAKARAIEL